MMLAPNLRRFIDASEYLSYCRNSKNLIYLTASHSKWKELGAAWYAGFKKGKWTHYLM